MLVAAIDAGSPRNLGWAIAGSSQGEGNGDILTHLVQAIGEDRSVALGIEAPMWVPLARTFDQMTKVRPGIEQRANRAWSASAGACALASGLANLGWLLGELHARHGPLPTTTQPERFASGHARLFLWEAFVSGRRKGKMRSNADDARAAVEAFAAQWPTEIMIEPPVPAINLAWVAARAAGLAVRDDEAGLSVPIVASSVPLPLAMEQH